MQNPVVNVLEEREKYLAYQSNDRSSPDKIDRMIEFLCLVGRLKTLDRRGWTAAMDPARRITKPESIAGHMYRMAIMAMLMDEDDGQEDEVVSNGETSQNSVSLTFKPKLDIGKMIQLSLVHDMAECIVGDVTPLDNIEIDVKHSAEQDVMNYLGGHLAALYAEYELKTTPEAVLVKELDRFDIMVETFSNEQYARHVEHRSGVEISELHEPAAANRHPLLQAIYNRIDQVRKEIAANRLKM